MRTILACLDPDNFYRLVLSDETLSEVTNAQAWLQGCPFDGELWIYTSVYHLNVGQWITCRLAIRADSVCALVRTWKEENLLEYGDNLLALPSIWLTRRFRLMQQEAQKYLSESDMNLIHTWEQLHAENLQI